MLQQWEIRQDLVLLLAAIAIAIFLRGEQSVVHVLGTHVARRGLKEHTFVEASPNVLGRVDEVLDAARHAVGPGSGLGMELGLGVIGL